MLNFLLKVIAFLFESSYAWILCLIAIFFGGAMFVAYRQSGETNVKELVLEMFVGDRATRAQQQLFWDRNPNLEYVRRYSQSSITEVRVRDSSSRTAVIDRSILSGVRLQTSPCEGPGMFPAAEIYAGATDLVCFALSKPGDTDGEYKYRFAASYTAPAKAVPVGEFYDKFLRSRGLELMILQDDLSVQILEGTQPGIGTMMRVSIRNYGGTTHVFLAASDAFAAQRSNAPAPMSGEGRPLTTSQQQGLTTLKSISQALPKVGDADVEDQLATFDELLRLLPKSQRTPASEFLVQAAELCPQPARKERLHAAAQAVLQGTVIAPSVKNH